MAQNHAAATAASVMTSSWILSVAFTHYTNTLLDPKLQWPAFRMSNESSRRRWPCAPVLRQFYGRNLLSLTVAFVRRCIRLSTFVPSCETASALMDNFRKLTRFVSKHNSASPKLVA
jgi:hypothetical protein